MPLYAGKLDRRVTFQKPPDATDLTKQQNPFGEPPDDWTDLFTSWAMVEPLSGRELFQAQQVNPEISHRVTIRWRTDGVTISPKLRISYDGLKLNVMAVLEIGRREGMELLCGAKAKV